MRISDWSSDVCSSDLKPDHVGIIFVRGFEDLRPGHHHAEVDDLEAVALEHDADDILADIVDVALDRRHHDLALALRARLLRRLDEGQQMRSEEHTSELQSLMRISYAVFCLKKKKTSKTTYHHVH